MLVSVLQNRLKPIWPSLYRQLKVASHQDGPSTASTSLAGGRSSPRAQPITERRPRRGFLISPKYTHVIQQPAHVWVT